MQLAIENNLYVQVSGVVSWGVNCWIADVFWCYVGQWIFYYALLIQYDDHEQCALEIIQRNIYKSIWREYINIVQTGAYHASQIIVPKPFIAVHWGSIYGEVLWEESYNRQEIIDELISLRPGRCQAVIEAGGLWSNIEY